MKARLIILVVLAAGLDVWFAGTNNAAAPDDDTIQLSAAEKEEIRRAREMGTELGKRPLPGEEPSEKPEVLVQVEVDESSGKNRLNFIISEAHGYYVESFTMEVWYTGSEGYDSDDSPLRMEIHRDVYLRANETLRECTDVVPAELSRIDDDMGTSSDWDTRGLRHGRSRANDPDPLPLLADMLGCDES